MFPNCYLLFTVSSSGVYFLHILSKSHFKSFAVYVLSSSWKMDWSKLDNYVSSLHTFKSNNFWGSQSRLDNIFTKKCRHLFFNTAENRVLDFVNSWFKAQF